MLVRSAIATSLCVLWFVTHIAFGLGAVWQVTDSKELQNACNSAQPGDAVELVASHWQDVDVVVPCFGSEDKPIVIQPRAGTQVVFKGRCRIRLAGQHLVIRNLDFVEAWHDDAIIEFRKDSKRLAAYCKLEGCRFVNCNPADLKKESKIISLYGHDNVVEKCEIEGKKNRGATVVVWLADQPVRHVLRQNYFGPRPRLGKNGGETIRIGDSETSHVSAQCRVEENLFEECNGEAEIISNKSCDNVYLHNTFRRCEGALTLRHGDRCRVEGNFFLGESVKGTGGVRVIGEDHVVCNNLFSKLEGTEQRAALSVMNGLENSPANGYAPVRNAQVVFNTFFECKQSLLLGLKDEDKPGTVAPVNCKFIGNMIVSSRGPLIQSSTNLESLAIRSNCFYGSKIGYSVDSSNTQRDPMLVVGLDGIVRPATNSLFVEDADRQQTETSVDIEGQSRKARTSIGCDDAVDQPIRFRPLDRSIVGSGRD